MAWKAMDGAPRDGRPILVRRGGRRFVVRWSEDNGHWSLDLHGEDYGLLLGPDEQPDGWCELEALPEGVEAE